MKINLKKEKGFTAVDLGLAMLVIIIFAVIMTSVSYSVYSSSIEAKRTATALNYCVDIFEHIGELDYEDVTVSSGEIFYIDGFNNFVQENTSTDNGTEIVKGNIGTYNIELKIEDYNGQDVIKIITLKMTYAVSRDHTEEINLQRLKVKSM